MPPRRKPLAALAVAALVILPFTPAAKGPRPQVAPAWIVAHHEPVPAAATKRPRQEGELTLRLAPTPDILQATRELRPPGSLIVGFALETGDAVAKGRAKLERKLLDLIVVNDALEAGAAFEVDTNRVTILDRAGGEFQVPLGSKRVVADAILDRVEQQLGR